MPYYSTNGKEKNVSLKDAVLRGQASDKGLFMPDSIPLLPEAFFKSLPHKSLSEIGFEVSQALFKKEIEPAALKKITDEALNFPIPLVPVTDRIHSLELFHGPTLAFKDVGARFMARMVSHFNRNADKEVTVLVATSGDTGSAVANGFLGIDGIRVVILYPSGKVSKVQEQQLTTLGQNIHALEVDGSFDDCQALVKNAFVDKELNEKLTLTSANSINIARLVPQSFYYHYAFGQLKGDTSQVIVSVPSGNFGNLTAGLLAKRMGLPIARFLAATNSNDVVPKYLLSGDFDPKPSIATISNAMDVGNPSNFARMMDLYGFSSERLSHHLAGYSYTDDQTRETMREVYQQYQYLLDPHGAIGFRAAKEYLATHEGIGIFLETAHPTKFIDVVEETLGFAPELPLALKAAMDKTKQATPISKKIEDLKDWLMG